jgi:hypothetical protein
MTILRENVTVFFYQHAASIILEFAMLMLLMLLLLYLSVLILEIVKPFGQKTEIKKSMCQRKLFLCMIIKIKMFKTNAKN